MSLPVRRASQAELEAINNPDWTCFYRRYYCKAEELLSAVGYPFKLTPILHFCDFLDEWVHVIASHIVEERGMK